MTELEKKIVVGEVQKSAPTAHLPKIQESTGGTQTSVPTNHLPKDVAPTPTPSPSKKD